MASRSVRCAFLDPALHDVELTLPSTVRRATATSSFAVVRYGGLEVELNASAHDFVPDYFAAAAAKPEDAVHLRNGHRVRLGRIGGHAGNGHCFSVDVGHRSLLGAVPASVSVTTLTTWLNDLHVTSTTTGLKVHPSGHARWAPGRAPHLVVVVTMTSGEQVLLDVRPAYRKASAAMAGLAVAGGRLSRVAVAGRPEYLTLDAPSHVVHVLPPTDEHLDEVAELGAHLAVRTLAG